MEPQDHIPLDTSVPDRYWDLSMRPLHVLVFLLPLVLMYELGSAIYLHDPESGLIDTISAQKILGDFFQLFGVLGIHIPAATLIIVLFIWHLLRRDPWALNGRTLACMPFESALWSLPLIVFAALLSGGAALAMTHGSTPGAASLPGSGTAELVEWPLMARLTIAIGAGLYEELLFRLILLAAGHLILADLVRLKEPYASLGAVVFSAVAFALYHDVVWRPDGVLDAQKLFFFVCAGMYFAAVYLLRGFGIVVGCHAVYDIIVLVLIGKGV